MARDLKIYMRGKSITMLQQLLQRMGYSIHDRPGLFGVSTRDAVKNFQSIKGLQTTGIVDDALMELLRQNFGSQVAPKKSVKESAAPPPLAHVNQQQLDALIRLLVSKGIISEQELLEEIQLPQPARITQPPLI